MSYITHTLYGILTCRWLCISRFINIKIIVSIICVCVVLPVVAEVNTYAGKYRIMTLHAYGTADEMLAHFPYVNPDARKGGKVVYGELGTFDTLNPYTLRGKSVWGTKAHVFETLMKRSWDQPFALYPLLAEGFDIDPDGLWVEFYIHPQSEFSDGTRVRPEDVIASFNMLTREGHPRYNNSYRLVKQVVKASDSSVRFIFSEIDKEAPLLVSLMPVLPARDWEGEDFQDTTIRKLIGSGPYVIDDIDQGRSVTFRYNNSYWGKDLPVNIGYHNFELIKYQYFRDESIAFEAFKSGEVSIFRENNLARWDNELDVGNKAASVTSEDKYIHRGIVTHKRPGGMFGFVFNTREPIFNELEVRRAIAQMFDFYWVNSRFFSGGYKQIQSYFDNSEFAFEDDITPEEIEVLMPFADELPEDTLSSSWRPYGGTGNGVGRNDIREVRRVLSEFGWIVKNGVISDSDGNPFTFEIMVSSRELQRIAQTFSNFLKKAGITANVALLDSARYHDRLKTYDFDMIIHRWWLSLSPGAEQYNYWGSRSAGIHGSSNFAGVSSSTVDALIQEVLDAETPELYKVAVRSLDRVLSAGTYVIPLWYSPVDRLYWWSGYNKPDYDPLYGYDPERWWYEGTKTR